MSHPTSMSDTYSDTRSYPFPEGKGLAKPDTLWSI